MNALAPWRGRARKPVSTTHRFTLKHVAGYNLKHLRQEGLMHPQRIQATETRPNAILNRPAAAVFVDGC